MLRRVACFLAAFGLWFVCRDVAAQSFGIELHNTLMPASGAMGGASLTQPQDLLSALNGNPATMMQFAGTQFMFGGAWAEPAFDLNQSGNLLVPGVTPFSAASGTPGTGAANIGLTQNFSDSGLPVTIGLGLISNAGGGVDFRGVPQSNGTSSSLLNLQITGGASAALTDRLSLGGTISLGEGFFDGPFVGAGAMVMAYGLRGAVGLNYALTPATSVGMYYQTREDFVFEDAIRLELFNGQFTSVQDVRMDLPDNIGFGVANSSLMDGRLLVAMDVLFKEWDNADLFKNIYHNQWVLQFGAQYSLNKLRLRAGYVWAENPIAPLPGVTIGGVTLPGGLPAANYLQSQMAIINQHRLSAGIGLVDVMPGLDMNLFAGTMLRASQQLGDFTSVTVSGYWVGLGLTWRFGAGRAGACGCGGRCGGTCGCGGECTTCGETPSL